MNSTYVLKIILKIRYINEYYQTKKIMIKTNKHLEIFKWIKIKKLIKQK